MLKGKLKVSGVSRGGTWTDVRMGKYEGKSVAVKTLKAQSESDDLDRRREVCGTCIFILTRLMGCSRCSLNKSSFGASCLIPTS